MIIGKSGMTRAREKFCNKKRERAAGKWKAETIEKI